MRREPPRKIRVTIMNMRDGMFMTEDLRADSRVDILFAVACRQEYAADKVRFYLAKNEDGSWIHKSSYEALWLFFRKQTKPLLRDILAKPPLERSMRLDDPRCLGEDYAYNYDSINFLVVLPYKRRLDRWIEKLQGRSCAS